ncbi:DUF5995 family protein [Sorangium sp. So ce327]|uniref:DUF5995 family protein n=1 Tax=Sorangium sp. So ce327 TaxID=3133301 RepID=UPI003F63725F
MQDNEIYYFQIAHGNWTGNFSFKIVHFGRLMREAPLPEQLWAVALHLACRLAQKQVITSTILGYPGSRVARSWAVVTANTFVFTPPVRLYALRGHYQLDPDGTNVVVRMREEFGPIPLLFHRDTRATARITDEGRRAEYQRTMFGSAWQGVYEVAPTSDEVHVRYSSAWGELKYTVRKTQLAAPLLRRSVSDAEMRLVAIAEQLDRLTEEQRSRRDMKAVFTGVYAQMSYALSRVLQQREIEVATQPRLIVKKVNDPDWVAALAEAFVARYLGAVDAYERGRYTPRHWALVFDTLKTRALTEIDALALTMFAHIVADLPHALCDVGAAPGSSEQLEDFEVVNEVASQQVADMKQRFADTYGSLYGWLDLLDGQIADVFLDRRVRELRSLAWYTAARLRGSQAARLDAEAQITRSVEEFVSDLLDVGHAPVALAASLFRRVVARRVRW